MAGTQSLQDVAKGCRIQQVRGYGEHAINIGGRSPRQSVYLPAAIDEVPRKVVSDNAARADHKC
jgi:hypothetical protein